MEGGISDLDETVLCEIPEFDDDAKKVRDCPKSGGGGGVGDSGQGGTISGLSPRSLSDRGRQALFMGLSSGNPELPTSSRPPTAVVGQGPVAAAAAAGEDGGVVGFETDDADSPPPAPVLRRELTEGGAAALEQFLAGSNIGRESAAAVLAEASLAKTDGLITQGEKLRVQKVLIEQGVTKARQELDAALGRAGAAADDMSSVEDDDVLSTEASLTFSVKPINALSGRVVRVSVPLSASVDAAKQQVDLATGISTSRQTFVFAGKELKSGALSAYHVPQGAYVSLFVV